jgi:predicted O-methyltransferase YrrM
MLKKLIKKTPVVRTLARKVLGMIAARQQNKFASGDYWEERYKTRGNSGAGSYNRLAYYKAELLNAFIAEHGIKSVIEFGSGDGAQLKLAEYPDYTGVDISETVIALTRREFAGDKTKRFLHSSEMRADVKAELSLSLDVVYHLIEQEVFENYLQELFDSSTRYAIVYSSDKNEQSDAVHVKHRKFTDWVAANRGDFRLLKIEKNPYSWDVADPDNTSFADFFVFERIQAA